MSGALVSVEHVNTKIIINNKKFSMIITNM